MAIRRYEGDDIKNPIYVLRDSDIPRTFQYTNDRGNQEEFENQPSKLYYPYSDEFPDVPPLQVIGAEDIRKLYPGEDTPDDSLAMFVVNSIRINLIQEFVAEWYILPGLKKMGAPPGWGVGYYFVGEVQLIDYCSGNPRLDYYTFNSERSLEINLAGKNLEKIRKVYFQYPNGVIKEAQIVEGDVSRRDMSRVGIFEGGADIDSSDIYRDSSQGENLQFIKDIINRFDLSEIELDFISGKKFYALPTKDLVKTLTEAGIDFKFERDNTASLNATIALTLAGAGAGGMIGAQIGAIVGVITGLIATMGFLTFTFSGVGAAIGSVAGGVIGGAAGFATGLSVEYAVYSNQYGFFRFVIKEEDAVELKLDKYEQIDL